MSTIELLQTQINTPLGQMIACASIHHLYMLDFDSPKHVLQHQQALKKELSITHIHLFTGAKHPIFTPLSQQLQAYFSGQLRKFDIPYKLTGTDFQKQVWQALLDIPFGQTKSYAQQALHINRPTAVRAVALANGGNKISILIPCHRVIGSNGSLTGYSGELWRKKELLLLESSPTLALQ